MKSRFRMVGVGGTFDELHKGHWALLMKAFESGDKVWIGLSTDEFVEKIRKNHKIASYETRKKELMSFLEENGLVGRAIITPLRDSYGPAIHSKRLEAIVVSQETKPTVEKINTIRTQKGLPLLKVIVISMIPADNHIPISTTRIRQGEIDREGRMLIS